MKKELELLQADEYIEPTFLNGFKSGIPIALGYFVVAFTFGMTACLGGFTPLEAFIMSATNVTSAGQFAGMQLINQSSPYLEICLTVFIINIRYLLMSTVLSQKTDETMSFFKRSIISFGITDETFTVASVEVKTITFPYFSGLYLLPFIGWTAGTLAGSFMDSIMSSTLQSAASITLYCMFIALVLPPSKHHKDIRTVVILTILFRIILSYTPVLCHISSGYSIILASCLASLIGAFLFHTERMDIHE